MKNGLKLLAALTSLIGAFVCLKKSRNTEKKQPCWAGLLLFCLGSLWLLGSVWTRALWNAEDADAEDEVESGLAEVV